VIPERIEDLTVPDERAVERRLARADARYPAALREMPDAPATLYVCGRLLETDALAVAIVGSRRATFYGLDVAETLAADLAARGVTIVSGLARGIDAAAHRGALRVGGRTIAVLGSGADVIYPAEHRRLAAEIAERGAVLSQFAPGTPPLPQNFPARNRVIAALSLAVVVVEADHRAPGRGTGARGARGARAHHRAGEPRREPAHPGRRGGGDGLGGRGGGAAGALEGPRPDGRPRRARRPRSRRRRTGGAVLGPAADPGLPR
jgi:DNA protecting protein DprA